MVNFSAEEDRTKVMTAMQRLQNETCIRFVPYYEQKHYININNKEKAGCFAVVGYHKNAEVPHPVNLETPGCLKHQGTIEHELLHIIGLFHEQSRHDRDDHVIIYWGNITEGIKKNRYFSEAREKNFTNSFFTFFFNEEYKSNFAKIPESDATAYNVSYDIGSVMHYPRHSFSKNGNETIVYKVSYF